jgi:dienelactone hydrolase
LIGWRAAVASVALIAATAAHAETFRTEELRLPIKGAGSRGLEALLIKPDSPGRFPLVIINHGSPRKPEDRRKMTPWSSYPMAVEFARRGFAAAVVMRRGYGTSGGEDVEGYHSCSNPDYVTAGRATAQTIKAAIKDLSGRPDIDGTRIVSVGRSAGGFGTVALTADPPPGLLVAINFAGGRGSTADFSVCNEERLVSAFRVFGKTSRVPMLWVYSDNDHYFGPAVAEKFHHAFESSGGKAILVKAPAFGKDGHQLFSLTGTPHWLPLVDEFFASHELKPRETLLPYDLPKLTTPSMLKENGRRSFEFYRRAGQHKAFAVSDDGHFGWQTARRSAAEAKSGALKFCNMPGCRIVFVDDAAAP